jgi:Ca2+/H+ antiporter, TMEM165/GDT1 family
MTGWTATGPSMLASFLASLVEFVEALTIVLAVGVVRGWRSALIGAGAGVALLTALVLALGTSLAAVPLPILQLVVGVLLLMFGLRWLSKAVLRQAGVLPLHDEAEAFAKESERMRRASGGSARTIDKIAFIATFKAVVLEGIEVVFIVIALGAGGRLLVPATVGAGLALAVVLGLGLWLHRPLARVPENSLKLGVGVMLAAFGTFWVGAGIGLHWPGEDAAIVYLIAAFLALALVLVQASRRLRAAPRQERATTELAPTPIAGPLVAAAAELWGLFVDDGWLAGGILTWALGAWALAARHPAVSASHCAVFVAGVLLLLTLSVVHRARRQSGTR